MKTTNSIELKVVSFNCRGLSSLLEEIKTLCKTFDIILLQETWLAKQNLDFLNSINNQHSSYGISSFSYETKLHSGRPYGGTAILWNKQLQASTFSNHDNTIIGLKVNLCSSSISFINPYLPYCCESNTDTYLEYLGKLGELCEDIQHPNMCIIGDFNASNNNMFGPLLNSFCQDLNLTMSDEAMLPKKSFTYVSDAHNTCSWIDHCMSSCAAHTSTTKIEVLHNFITSDHHPLSITFNCKFFTQIAVDEPVPDYFNVKWSKVSQTNKANYHEATKHYLNNIFLPFEVIKCNDAHCCDQKHLELINKFYSDIVYSLATIKRCTWIFLSPSFISSYSRLE